jgi:hypothetical protein
MLSGEKLHKENRPHPEPASSPKHRPHGAHPLFRQSPGNSRSRAGRRHIQLLGKPAQGVTLLHMQPRFLPDFTVRHKEPNGTTRTGFVDLKA